MQYKKKGIRPKIYIKLAGHRYFQTVQWIRQNYMKIRNLFSD